jgi:hypothetical protein
VAPKTGNWNKNENAAALTTKRLQPQQKVRQEQNEEIEAVSTIRASRQTRRNIHIHKIEPFLILCRSFSLFLRRLSMPLLIQSCHPGVDDASTTSTTSLEKSPSVSMEPSESSSPPRPPKPPIKGILLVQRQDSEDHQHDHNANNTESTTGTATHTTTATPTKSRNKHPVSFPPTIVSHVESIPNHDTLTPEQHVELWYDTAEVAKIHKECAETVRKMHHGEPLPDDDDADTTSRGLEYMTPGGFDITASSREAVRAVLDEQARQKADGEEPDPELLADVSESVSRHRSRIAHLAGLKDQRAAARSNAGEYSMGGGASSSFSGNANGGGGGSVWGNTSTHGGGGGGGSVWGKNSNHGTTMTMGELPLRDPRRAGHPARTSSFGSRRSAASSLSSSGGGADGGGTGIPSRSPLERRSTTGTDSRPNSRSPGRLRVRRQRSSRPSDTPADATAEATTLTVEPVSLE